MQASTLWHEVPLSKNDVRVPSSVEQQLSKGSLPELSFSQQAPRFLLLEGRRNRSCGPREPSHLRTALSGQGHDLGTTKMLKDMLREGVRLCPVSPGIGMRMKRKDIHLKNETIVTSPPQGS